MNKRFMAILLVLCMALTLLPVAATAIGDGSADDPIIIRTPEDLNDVRNNLSAYYILANNIDLTSWLSANGGYKGWEPIGNGSTSFNGTFDGDGNTISGLWINRPDDERVGLFGLVGDVGMIEDLGVEIAAKGILGGDYVGGLAGQNVGKIVTSYTTGGITTATYTAAIVGGLVGFNNGGIYNCYAEGAVAYSSMGAEIGGLVGLNGGGTVMSCYAAGEIKEYGEHYRIGGLVGDNTAGVVTACFYDKTTTKQTDGVGYDNGSLTSQAVGKTTADMRKKATFEAFDWSFDYIWDIDEGNDYPRLRVFGEPSDETDPVVTDPIVGEDLTVATIGEAQFYTLEAAIDEVMQGDVIELVSDITRQNNTIINLGSVPNLNGVTEYTIALGNFTITSNYENYIMQLADPITVHITAGTGGIVNKHEKGIAIGATGEDSKITINGGTYIAGDDALISHNEGVVEIIKGVFISEDYSDDGCICGEGITIASGSSASPENWAEIEASKVTVTVDPIVTKHTIGVSSAGNGTATANLTSAEAGVVITLTATPNTGYKFKEWLSGDVTIAGNKFTMPAKNVTIMAVFEAVVAVELPPNPFRDIKESDWFYKNVLYAYSLGLINGKTPTEFQPDVNLTYAEAVKLAACMHELYTTGEITPGSGNPWYQCYVNYAKANNIISVDYAWDMPATRAGYMAIFANALPAEALEEMNAIADGAIPDVPPTHPNSAAIYKLYRAGIVQGVDTVTFACNPSANIKRSEVSAVLSRMMDPTVRVSFSIGTVASSG